MVNMLPMMKTMTPSGTFFFLERAGAHHEAVHGSIIVRVLGCAVPFHTSYSEQFARDLVVALMIKGSPSELSQN